MKPVAHGRKLRSKDILDGEINSRVMSDIHSDDFDGSLTDPETNPGTTGWAIFKNGLMVAQNGIFRGIIRAAEIVGGVVQITGGGRLVVGDDLEDPPVELNQTGLFIGGIQQPDAIFKRQAGTNFSLTTTNQKVAEVSFPIPPAASFAYIQGSARVNVFGGSGFHMVMEVNAFLDSTPVGGPVSFQSVDADYVNMVTPIGDVHALTGQSELLLQHMVRLSSGTNSNNAHLLGVTVLFR